MAAALAKEILPFMPSTGFSIAYSALSADKGLILHQINLLQKLYAQIKMY
jgi:hypothetical protein